MRVLPTCVPPANLHEPCNVRPAAFTPQQRMTRRQLHSALGAVLLSGPLSRPATAAAEGSGARRQEVERIERAYDGYAATYDDLDGGGAAEQLGFPALRQQLLALAHGDVLETAVGTGLNLPFYNAPALASLTAIDLSSGMLGQARRRAAQLGLGDRVQLVQADVERLQEALDGRTFDTGGWVLAACMLPW